MANLPTSLTDMQIADLPWINGANAAPPRLDVTGHNDTDIKKFRDALAASRIPTKEVVTDGVTYVEAATDVPNVQQRLETIRLKHLPLVDGDGNKVTSYKQFDTNTTLVREDALFADLNPSAEAGARAENPAALQSLTNVFNRNGIYGVEVTDGQFKVLASEPNKQFLTHVETIDIKDQFDFIRADKVKSAPNANATPAQPNNYFGVANMVELTEPPIETSPIKVIANNLINQIRHNPALSLGATIITADAAYVAWPALRKGEYADATLIAINSSVNLGAELVVASECTAEVATAAAPLLASPPAYAGAVLTGGAICATGSHYLMLGGNEATAIIEERVKEVAANNGLDPEHIWASMLEKTQEASIKPTNAEPTQER